MKQRTQNRPSLAKELATKGNSAEAKSPSTGYRRACARKKTVKKRSASSNRRSGAVSSGACTGAVAAEGTQRGAAVVVLAHANTTFVLEVVDLDHPVRDLEAAVLTLALPTGDDDDGLPSVDHLLDLEVELPDGGAPLRPVVLDALVAVVGAGVRIVLGRDPLHLGRHVIEHPRPIT